MRWMLAVVLLGLSVLVSARGDDPKPKSEAKPQWQRLLTGADTRAAADLTKRIEKLEAADKYAEAIRLREELLALRTRVQGADHWQTANEKWTLATAKKVAALPPEQRAGWRRAAEDVADADRLQERAQFARDQLLWQERLRWCRDVLGEAPETAKAYGNVASTLWLQSKYRDAAPLFQKALDMRRKLLGEDHPDTATTYDDMALNVDSQGRYAAAQRLFEKALEIRRSVLGDNHADTATTMLNLAGNLHAQGKYPQAGPLLRKALDIFRKVRGENHQDTAAAYGHLAGLLIDQSRYDEATPLVQKALDIRRKLFGDYHPDTAESYENFGTILYMLGRHAEAGPLLQRTLIIRRKLLGEHHPETARSYQNIAANLAKQGKYARAEPVARKALDIRRQVLGEKHADTARSYDQLAGILDGQHNYAQAEPLYRKALSSRREILGEKHPDTATSYSQVGLSLEEQGKHAEAEQLFRKALEIERKVLGENHRYTATSYNNLSASLDAQGKHAEAALLVRKALEINRKVLGEGNPQTLTSYRNVAYSLLELGHDSEALQILESAARSYEIARLHVAGGGLDRAAAYGASSPYPFLAAARCRAGNATAAWPALEADLARGLLDEFGSSALTAAEQRQREQLLARKVPLERRLAALVSRSKPTDAEAAELQRLLAQRQQMETAFASLAVAVSRRELADLSRVQASLPDDAAFVAWVDVADKSARVEEHWGCVVRRQGDPHWERLPGSGPGGQWTDADRTLPYRFYLALAKSASHADAEDLGKKLLAQRIAPLGKHLDGVRHLFVAPVDRMAGVPVEALTDRYTVSYIPSGTILARLEDRKRPQSNGLLAVGDPVFRSLKDSSPSTALPPGGLLITQVLPGGAAAKARLQAGDVLVAYAGEALTSVQQLGKLIAARAGAQAVVKVWRDGQDRLAERELAPGRLGVALAKEPAREAIKARRRTDQLLAELSRGEPFAELPGTRVEIARLAELFEPGNVIPLTRAAASEQRLDELRRAGKLKQFRYLHFATHGKASLVRAFDSALILTRPARLPQVRVGEPYLEGRLTAAEVLQYWKLDAELVTLSACESGLGREGGGDGLLGFAQAFLLAGSRSVCLTLWQVDDTATVLLMDRFYRNLRGQGARREPMRKAAALREAKQWLRHLTSEDALHRLGALTDGVVRGERPAREEMRAVPRPRGAAPDYRPYAHPRYWAAFILIGDPE